MEKSGAVRLQIKRQTFENIECLPFLFNLMFFFLAMAAAANGVLGDCKPGCKGAAHTFVARKRKIVYDTRDEN